MSPAERQQQRRGEQPGKRESEQRNDPEAQPGAREGQPAQRKEDAAPTRPASDHSASTQ
ncbi:hypothetical protein [Pseudoxanthomonas sp.]|uniref:hypothetical protein n=1 Tax=Pseudoxanthomonas sp. TaxID=1871049 RepID=UPI00258DED8D|nr:hypothetical protein [Pseudoxanthomonas sp.]MCR6686378.1 hypothetical protein [Pseudoxanthomonas sp.]